jgi:hypothetical protein
MYVSTRWRAVAGTAKGMRTRERGREEGGYRKTSSTGANKTDNTESRSDGIPGFASIRFCCAAPLHPLSCCLLFIYSRFKSDVAKTIEDIEHSCGIVPPSTLFNINYVSSKYKCL